ncbi:hypothetical protein EIP86_008011 [Pleurotus ostreatoroseus]|nr:hypothetical protein EIP86_008011 [Pleurotus ostreatoroseus]
MRNGDENNADQSRFKSYGVVTSMYDGELDTRVADLGPGQIQNLVTFGDSYTDVVNPGDGSVSWPTYAALYGNFTLFPFAHGGASCSKSLTPLPFESLDPYLFEVQLPQYLAEKANGPLHSVDADETMYTLWIGTNDIGANALLTGEAEPNVTVVDTVTCAMEFLVTLYHNGARNLIFQNVSAPRNQGRPLSATRLELTRYVLGLQLAPLQRTVLYSADSYPNKYWDAVRNTTAWNVAMTELVASTNEIAKLMVQALPSTLLGAHIGFFDSHKLFNDVLANPGAYLNGTAPINLVTPIKSCVFALNQNTSETGNCTTVTGAAVDSYMW